MEKYLTNLEWNKGSLFPYCSLPFGGPKLVWGRYNLTRCRIFPVGSSVFLEFIFHWWFRNLECHGWQWPQICHPDTLLTPPQWLSRLKTTVRTWSSDRCLVPKYIHCTVPGSKNGNRCPLGKNSPRSDVSSENSYSCSCFCSHCYSYS